MALDMEYTEENNRMVDFIEVHLKKEALERFGLPDVGYPFPDPTQAMAAFSGDSPEFDLFLYSLQLFCEKHPEKWEEKEVAMRRLAELLAPKENLKLLTVQGEEWLLHCGLFTIPRLSKKDV